MADKGGRPAPRLTFAHGIQSAENPAAEGLFEKDSELSRDLDEEERARKIAEQDFNQKKKQVGLPTARHTSLPFGKRPWD